MCWNGVTNRDNKTPRRALPEKNLNDLDKVISGTYLVAIVGKPDIEQEVWRFFRDHFDDRVEDGGEDKPNEGIPLVASLAALDDGIAKHQVGLSTICVLDPAGCLGEELPDFTEGSITIKAIECIDEVNLE